MGAWAAFGFAKSLPAPADPSDEPATFRVKENLEITIRQWLGSTRIPLCQVIELKQRTLWRSIFSLAMGKAHRLKWLDDHGRTQSLIFGLSDDLINADRFQALIDQAIESRPDPDDSESTEDKAKTV